MNEIPMNVAEQEVPGSIAGVQDRRARISQHWTHEQELPGGHWRLVPRFWAPDTLKALDSSDTLKALDSSGFLL